MKSKAISLYQEIRFFEINGYCNAGSSASLNTNSPYPHSFDTRTKMRLVTPFSSNALTFFILKVSPC